jgi:hypothetical protein
MIISMNLPSRKRLPFDQPAIYQIWVQGRIDPDWLDNLGGMSVYLAKGDENPLTTTLMGELRDQAALLGVLNTLYEMHLPVLAVVCLSPENTSKVNLS